MPSTFPAVTIPYSYCQCIVVPDNVTLSSQPTPESTCIKANFLICAVIIVFSVLSSLRFEQFISAFLINEISPMFNDFNY